MGLQNEGSLEARHGLARAHVIGQMEEHADKLRAQQLKLFKSVGDHPHAAFKPYTRKNLDKDMKALKAIMAQPDALSQHLPTDSDNYPETTIGAVATTQRAVSFLVEKAPKNPYEGLPEAFQRPWEPSQAELAKFGQYSLAVKDPTDAMARLLKGISVEVTSETLQTVYPGYWASVQRQAMERLSDAPKPLTFKQRMALQPLLGSAVLGMSPEAAQLIQNVTAPKSGEAPPNPGDGRQRVDVEKNLQTQAQRTEAR
jgi:hypothetical protein